MLPRFSRHPSPVDRTGERERMVEQQLRRRGIEDRRVLDAVAVVPRERFVPPEQTGEAYEDRAVPVGEGQTLSQPYMVAVMTEALRLREGDRVLEIGTGSGYQTAVLAHLVERVYTIERLATLARGARSLLEELGMGNVVFRIGDGTLGWPEAAPFDRILITAAAPEVPKALQDQLDPRGGRLVVPVGDRRLQRLVAIEREGDRYHRENLLECRFVPLVGEGGWTGPEPGS